VIAESLQRANVLKINDEELDVVATMLFGEPTVPGKLIAEDPEKTRRICRELIARYELDMLILTCGAIGSYVFTASKESYVATPKVQVADTVGAGDSFTATFVAQLLLGKTIREAHEKAVAVSAFVCTQRGAMPTLPPELKA
jgi:fructokinase